MPTQGPPSRGPGSGRGIPRKPAKDDGEVGLQGLVLQLRASVSFLDLVHNVQTALVPLHAY